MTIEFFSVPSSRAISWSTFSVPAASAALPLAPLLGPGGGGAAAAGEDRRRLRIDQLDAEAVAGHRDLDLLVERPQVRRLGEPLPDALRGLFERGALALGHGVAVGRLVLRRRLRREREIAAGNRSVGLRLVEDAGVAEVAGHGAPHRLALADQPHHQEERHHRRHEVGVGHLPGAAVMAVGRRLPALDDDRRTDRAHAASACASAAGARQYCSVSENDGRSSAGMERRANSTAIAGASPLLSARTPHLIVARYWPSKSTRCSSDVAIGPTK